MQAMLVTKSFQFSDLIIKVTRVQFTGYFSYSRTAKSVAACRIQSVCIQHLSPELESAFRESVHLQGELTVLCNNVQCNKNRPKAERFLQFRWLPDQALPLTLNNAKCDKELVFMLSIYTVPFKNKENVMKRNKYCITVQYSDKKTPFFFLVFFIYYFYFLWKRVPSFLQYSYEPHNNLWIIQHIIIV